MRLLGYFHGVDPAACLLEDGEVVAYVEEERLVRIKHATGLFPIRSIDYCLEAAGVDTSLVKEVPGKFTASFFCSTDADSISGMFVCASTWVARLTPSSARHIGSARPRACGSV